jgi:hypothetical protein
MLPSKRRFFRSFLVVSVLAMQLAACGGGSGDSSNMSPPTPMQTGSVGILITDGPTDQFSEINATITEITLLGGGAPQVIFSGSTTIDLLDLGSNSDLFALADDVTPATFNKIRLTLSGLELVRRDVAGNVIERIQPRLPGNGKLDLNPRSSFAVTPGETLLIELDLDMDKSIHIVTTGNERVQFRPVIFVRILRGDLLGRLTRLFGTVQDIDATARSFDLCQLQRDGARFPATLDSQGMRDRCVEVFVDDATGIFGPGGDPIAFDALTAGDPATAVGHVRKHDDSDDDEDDGKDDGEDNNRFEDDLRLDAVVVEVGEFGSFARLKGKIGSVLDAATNRFDFAVNSGQGFAPDTTLSALVQDGTRIFSRDGTELDAAAIQVDREARIDGVVQLSSIEADTLKTALIVIGTDADALGGLSGNILTLDAANRSFNMSTATGDRCVRVPEDASIFLITIENSEFSSERGGFADLVVGQRVDVFGRSSVDGCLVANVVIAEQTV